MSRRNPLRTAALATAALLALSACSPGEAPRQPTSASPAPIATPTAPSADPVFAQLESTFDARLGVYALDTGTGRALAYNADERFAYASTVKALLAGVVLDATTDGELDTRVEYDSGDILDYAPITTQHLSTGMTLRELADAAVRYSDNTAANLLLDRIGGPAGLDAALSAIGDDTTQVDREEPSLNEATPGDTRDTSTPRAFATDLERFVLGDALDAGDRSTLTAWLVGNTTGDDLIRAGVPADWTVGDKTGTAGYGTRNDIAVLWPTDGAPVVLAIFSSRAAAGADHDDALIAQATRVALEALGLTSAG
jgi:beta-lactamase class A